MMDHHDEEEEMTVSVLHGDEFCISRILSRKSSVGQSSRIYYRPAKGIPFKWELQPGMPKNPQEDDLLMTPPPPSPSPLMQSLGLPLPNIDHDKPHQRSSSKTLKLKSLKEMMKKKINLEVNKAEMFRRKNKHKERPKGESLPSIKDLSISSVTTSSLSESSFSSDSRVLDSSMIDGPPFCCSPLNVPAVLVEGNTRIYYCSHHETAFAEEEDGSFLTRIHSRFPAAGADHLSGDETAPAGIPFRWEMQPGTPKRLPENELIPPPSPPPAVQSQALTRQPQGGKGNKASWNRIRDQNRKKEMRAKGEGEFSFGFHGNMEVCSSDDEYEEKMDKRSLGSRYLSCGSWSGRVVLAFARRKFKSLTF